MREAAGPDLFEALAAEHLRRPEVERRRMFCRDGLRAAGTYYAFLDRRGLVLKLSPQTTQALIDAGDAVIATSVSPTMRRWVLVPPPTGDADEQWRELLAEAFAYASDMRTSGAAARAEAADAGDPGELRAW